MKIQNPFKLLNKFEMTLWLTSVAVVILSYIFSGFEGTANTICSLVGVTALIFVAKGHVLGMVLCTIFAAFYGIIAFCFRYYGEVATYVGMTLPMDVFALVSWIRNPYKDTAEVKVARLKRWQTFQACSIAESVVVDQCNALRKSQSVDVGIRKSSLRYLRQGVVLFKDKGCYTTILKRRST